mmetsp:Transcript_35414/g.40946  ORF Transcript_35414/g.40946 Transcript_35414/m.40946 type:complete len:100 (+) Transcript_35414:378-677(+)
MEVFKVLISRPDFAAVMEHMHSSKHKPLSNQLLLDKIESHVSDGNQDLSTIPIMFETNGNSSDWNTTKNRFLTESSANSQFPNKAKESNYSFTANQISK